jgi:ABC-type anion transport system duplicated permease subunit
VRTFDTTSYVRKVLVMRFNRFLWRPIYAFSERRFRLG